MIAAGDGMANAEDANRELHPNESRAFVAEEYEAGYQGRFQNVAECVTATPCWRAGWQEADREIAIAVRSEQTEATSEPWSLYGTGHQARTCELPFDEYSADSWKRSWVQADITLGTSARIDLTKP